MPFKSDYRGKKEGEKKMVPCVRLPGVSLLGWWVPWARESKADLLLILDPKQASFVLRASPTCGSRQWGRARLICFGS